MATQNKVKFGLSQVHIYPITSDDATGTKYETGFPLLGAVNLSLSPEGDSESFYADNKAYYVSTANNGYSGSLEMAMLNDDFYTKILGMKLDETSGLMVESLSDVSKEFAMAFQFEGDKNATRHVLYRCKATRPKVEGETTSDKTTPKTDSFDFNAMARISDGKIKAKAEEGSKNYATFFDAVPELTA